jgi:hypothetical protein
VNRFLRLARPVWLPGVILLSMSFGASPAIANASLAAAADDTAGQAAAQIEFTYENPNLQPAKYVLTIREDGSGHYSSEPGPAAPGDNQPTPSRPQDRSIEISKGMRDALFSAARQAKYFAGSCDDQGGKIAFQGKKTLEYDGANGRGNCTYNRSNNKYIQSITDKLEGIALTLDEGGKLEMQHEYARLSLEPELEALDRLARGGNALELGTISPVLGAIADDNAVLELARRRARALLDMAKKEQ